MENDQLVNWDVVNEQIKIALSNYNKIMLRVKISVDFSYTHSIFFESSKKQKTVYALIPFPLKKNTIEEACLLSINSDKEILKSYTNAKIIEVIEIHQMSENGYSTGVIYNFRTK